MCRGAVAILAAVAPLVVGCSTGAQTTTGATSSGSTPSTITPGTAAPVTAAGGATTPASTTPCGTASARRQYRHVIWIWMENHQRNEVIGTREAPFASALARECGTAAHYSAVGSPSLPNYLAATSGSTQGVHDDGGPNKHPIDADNLFRQVRVAGGTARTYAEAMPAPCTLQSSGGYAVKHNPAAYYVGADDRQACRADDVPLGTLDAGPLVQDLVAGTLPTFAFVVPDLCHDTHDCSVADGDRWLASWVDLLVADPAYRDGSTALFVVWDEPTPMPFIALAPAIHQGATVSEPVDHYSLLRTTEELLGIDTYLGAANHASSMRSTLGL